MKAYLSSFILIIYFTPDYLLRSTFILDLVGVSCSHTTFHLCSLLLCIIFYAIYLQLLTPYLGLPVPIVAIAAGIAIEHYGSDNGLAHVLHIHT